MAVGDQDGCGDLADRIDYRQGRLRDGRSSTRIRTPATSWSALGEGVYQQTTPRTITDLLKNIESIDSLTGLSRYMHHSGRLHLIAGEQDPEVSDSLTAEEYLRIRKVIVSYYSVALTDCGTGVTHNAMSGILQSADNSSSPPATR